MVLTNPGTRGDDRIGTNSTTRRFSRRAGEAYRDCDYAQWIEAPQARRHSARLQRWLWAVAALATAVMVFL